VCTCVSTISYIDYHTNLVPHIDNLKKEVVDSEVEPTQTQLPWIVPAFVLGFLEETAAAAAAAAEQRGVAADGWACVLLIDHMDLQCP
jgi:hypothetical protein